MLITEFCNSFFDSKKWSVVPDSEKQAHGFNLLRFLSIRYPIEINATNHKDMDMISILDFWQLIFSKRFTKTPSWFWVTAGANKKRLEKTKIKFKKRLDQEFSGDLLSSYCNHVSIIYSELVDEFEINEEMVINKIKTYKNLLSETKK